MLAARAPTIDSAGCPGCGKRPRTQSVRTGLEIRTSEAGNSRSPVTILRATLDSKGTSSQGLVGNESLGLCVEEPDIVSRCK